MKSVAADIGNSRLKLLIGSELLAFNLNYAFYPELIALIGGSEFVYSSVNKKAEEKLVNALQEYSIKVRKIVLDDIKKIISLEGIEGMGIDRALGLAGALCIAQPPLITIDCGSALTVNILEKNCQFLGGIIMPGLLTQAESLKNINPILFPTHFEKPSDIIPKNTNDNVIAGILTALQGGVLKYLTEVFEYLQWSKETVTIFVTGGYRELIAEILEQHGYKIHLYENLVTLGIKSIVGG